MIVFYHLINLVINRLTKYIYILQVLGKQLNFNMTKWLCIKNKSPRLFLSVKTLVKTIITINVIRKNGTNSWVWPVQYHLEYCTNCTCWMKKLTSELNSPETLFMMAASSPRGITFTAPGRSLPRTWTDR